MAVGPGGQQLSSERLGELLGDVLSSGSDEALRSTLLRHSALPGPRMNLTLVDRFADVVAGIVRPPDPPAAAVDALEGLLDHWAAMSPAEAPGDQPAVVLPCSAVAAYGAVGAVRPEWWSDETAKLRQAASDVRWRVREMVAAALQRVLEVDWERTVAELARWAADADPLVVRAAAAGVAEPSLLVTGERSTAALAVQRRAVASLAAVPADRRRSEGCRVLRQGLGFTVSVVVAAKGDFSLLGELVRSDDADLRWVARENLRKKRLARWPEEVAGLRSELERGRR